MGDEQNDGSDEEEAQMNQKVQTQAKQKLKKGDQGEILKYFLSDEQIKRVE